MSVLGRELHGCCLNDVGIVIPFRLPQLIVIFEGFVGKAFEFGVGSPKPQEEN